AGGAPATTLNAGTSTFNFNGTAAQSITNGTAITFFNLTDSNITQPLTLNNSLAVNGTLNVNGPNAILSPVAAAVISGTGTLTGTGTARVSRIAATPDFLSQYTITNKTLTNLTIDYSGAGNQTVNNAPAYSHLRISGSGTKTLQGATSITGDLTLAAAVLDVSASNFAFNVGRNWTNNVGNAGFVPRSGTVTFNGTGVVQALTGNTTFFNLDLNNTTSLTNFASTTTTIQNNFITTSGTMQGGTSTIIFTGAAGSISGAAAKQFNNIQINAGAAISNATGGNTTILNDYLNNGTFTQAAGLVTTFTNGADGIHSLTGSGTSTFGNFTVNGGNTVNAAHNFNIVGAAFTANGAFNATAGTGAFTGGVPQSIIGDGTKSFSGLTIANAAGVTLANGILAADAVVTGLLTLTTDFAVAGGAILQQSGTSAGAADVLGTVRRADLGVIARSFGNVNNEVTINSGTPPTQLDFNLVKATPTGFPAGVKVVPRTYTLSPSGGAGISATLRLRYIDPAELSGPGITESRLVLWKDTTGSDNWVAQGGTVDAVNNHVTLTGISSFSEWAIAEAADLTLSKANNVSGSAVVGQSWNWTLTATNTGSPATFTAGQTIISDNLPNSNITYGTPTVQNATNITSSANISCAIVGNDLTCSASGGSVTFDSHIGASNFVVVFSATPQGAGSYQNPRTGGGIAQIDPNNVIAESNETNNSPAANTVTVGKADTTTTITADNPDPSGVGQPVTVLWTVAVTPPGALGAPLTGNVTVSDGTDSCIADVSAGQCDITFTSAGAKSITATYAGDSNYNGSASTPATPHTVNTADTTTTITADNPDPSTPGQSVTVEWTVTVNSPGSGTPTGNVTVTVSGGAETCNAPVATGQCSLVLNTNGIRTITATYAGDTNFNTSSDTEEHTVCGDSVVTTTADSGPGSLRQIIADACDNSSITFDLPGDGPHTITLTTGELVIAKNLVINNDSGEAITISGNNASRMFNINTGMTVAILDLTLTNGRSADGADGGAGVGGFGEDGGAIFNNGTLTLTRVNVTNSRSGDGGDSTSIPGEAGKGGGIYTTGSLMMIDCEVSGNVAGNGGSGGSNPGGGGDGGGIFVFTGTAALTGVTLDNNTAGDGAGGSGGGLFVRFTTTVTIIASEITNNDSGGNTGAEGFGGGVFNNGVLTVVSSTISNNSTDGFGGGIINQGTGNLTLVNSTISGNHSALGSHGLLNDSGTTMLLSNCTITNNSPSSGTGFGVVTNGGPAQVGNTIIAGNGGASGSDLSGAFTSLGNNLIGKSDGTNGFSNGVNGEIVGTIGSPINALLGALANNGGPTQTHALLPGSPAIEAGNNAIVSADTQDLDGDTNVAEPIPFDQRGTGFPRILDSADANLTQTIDIGAFELHPSIQDILNQSTNENTVANVGFNIGDDTGSLIASVTATSSNTTLVPNANLVITGSGGSRNLQVSPATNQTGITTITVTVTATNGRTAVDTFDLTVNAVTDAPVANNDSYSTDEDTPLVVNAASGVLSNDTDVDTPLASLTAILVSGPANALSFTLNADGSFNYTPSTNFNGSDSFTYKANDGSLDSNVATVTLTVNAINDPPLNLVPASQGTAQNTPIVFSAANSNQISVTDPDAGTNSIQVTLSAANGTLTLSGTTGLSFSFSDGNGTGTGDGTADTTITFRGTLANINTALNGMSFAPTVDFSGTASVTITSNDLGNTGAGGPLSDTDVVNIQVATTISIQDAQVAEPSAASVNMLFTVTLSAPAPAGGASVNFTTTDEPPSTGHAVAGEDYITTSGTVNFAVGEQFKTISVPILADGNSSEPNETFLVTLSSPVNATIVDGSATGTILVAEQSGAILISELRTSGPAGDGDDFIEIYNNSASSHTVAASDSSSGYGLFKIGSSCGVAPVLIGVIPNGTVIPGRGHFLFAGSAYSLTAYGASDQTMSSDIENDRNVGIFSTSNLAALSSANRLDAVGFGANSGGNCDLLREGATLTPMVGSVVEYSFFRDECGKKGNPAQFGGCPTGGFVKDSNNNNNDFIFADTQATMTPAGQRLGAPSPQNLGSPRLNLSIPAVLLDNTIAAVAPPNRFRDTGATGPNAANGTMSIRRRFVNNTGAPVTRLRFRIVDTSSFPVSIPVADLRVLSSSAFTVNGVLDPATCLASNGSATTPCTITVQGTTLETPPAQPLGGALNSSLTAGTIVLATPLAPGASINLQFLLGVQSTGSFKFFFNVEALP
ncbi:MAG TPA: Ig-like domain-containing protein, partial [Pyrinomonadaceae bacterium]|nr:Ig-like domain-containing protein [Pyrinomonadaceae bacterium]